MKGLTLLVLAAFAGLLIHAGSDFAALGDPKAPASTHVAARYIERSYPDTKTPNVVTSVLADYRGFDTLGETTVVFTAAVAAWCILLTGRRKEDDS